MDAMLDDGGWREEIVVKARALLRSGGCRARREIVRVTLELDRLLAEHR